MNNQIEEMMYRVSTPNLIALKQMVQSGMVPYKIIEQLIRQFDFTQDQATTFYDFLTSNEEDTAPMSES